MALSDKRCQKVEKVSMNKIICIIPARLASTRLPQKPLLDISGKTMIERTYMRAIKVLNACDVYIATDSEKVKSVAQNFGAKVLMTSDNCLTGTDRLAEVVKAPGYDDYDVYINIQGDEPIIDPEAISQLVIEYEKYRNQYSVYNLYKVIRDQGKISSNAIIKVIVNEQNDLMYMSRLPIPYSKNDIHPDYKQQIPVYAYTSEALEIFSSNAKTMNEIHEDIELLRFIDLGLKIKMCETSVESISVDYPDDILKIERFLLKSSCSVPT